MWQCAWRLMLFTCTATLPTRQASVLVLLVLSTNVHIQAENTLNAACLLCVLQSLVA